MKNYSLDRDNVAFLFIDIQDKLLNAMSNKDEVIKNATILAEMVKIMNLDSMFTVQYPKGLGYTNESVKASLADVEEIPKKSFSCMLDEEFVKKLESLNKKQIVISGIESHICVLLTARDLVKNGYEVFIASDAVGSRNEKNYNNALQQLNDMGCVISNVESIMFDLNSISGTDEFKAVQKLII